MLDRFKITVTGTGVPLLQPARINLLATLPAASGQEPLTAPLPGNHIELRSNASRVFILGNDTDRVAKMFTDNLTLIEHTLQGIADSDLPSGAAEKINNLRELGNIIEVNYQNLTSTQSRAGDPANCTQVLEEAKAATNGLLAEANSEEIDAFLNYFYIKFLLTNEAEKANIVAVNQLRDTQALISGDPKFESIEFAIKTLKDRGISDEKVQEIVDNLTLELVFTAHPTEAKKPEEILALQDISKVLRSEDADKSSALRRETRALKECISPRSDKPTVIEEVRRNLVYFDSIYHIIPRINREVRSAIKKYYPNVKIPNKTFVKYSSWVGGDRDGHPGVTATTHYDTAKLHHNQALEYYIGTLEYISNTDSNFKSSDIISKLQNRMKSAISRSSTYDNAESLIQDLNAAMERSVNHETKEMLEDLIISVKSFGFHLAQVDTREHSAKHEKALSEIFKNDEVKAALSKQKNQFESNAKSVAERLLSGESYETLTKDDRMAILSALVSSKEGINIATVLESIPPEQYDTNNTARVLRTFPAVKQIQKDFSPESANIQITSFTHDSSDVMEAVFLAKEAGLVTVNDDGSMKSDVDFMPLFETIPDLENIDKTLGELFKNETYRKVLKSRGNIQKVFLGYSDGTKDGGYAAAYAALWNAPNKVRKACEESGIEELQWEIFHGRGGSLGRGGGKAGEAITSQPHDTILNRIRITEQGEFLSFRYSDPEMAFRHLEIRIEALIRASANATNHDDKHAEKLLDIGKVAYKHYRELYENKALLSIIQNATPYRCIPYTNWASRPAIRWDPKQQFSLEELRAVPWVVIWNQIRMMVPGWYGMGLALNEKIENGSLPIEELQRMYKEFDAFRIEVDHCEMALAKSNMHAASLYAELLPADSAEKALFQSMLDEHLRTTNIINKIKGNNRLLDKNPTIQGRIDERNKDTHIINYIQVKVLREFYDLLKSDPEVKEDRTKQVLNQVLMSMKAIAAALQETG